MMKIQLRKVLWLIVLLINRVCFSNTIQVPQDYSTIQEAINEASDGDTVMVDTGRYIENIDFIGKNIVVTSRYNVENDLSYITKTIIDGRNPHHVDTASVVRFLSGEDITAVIEGFTITNGNATRVYNSGQWMEGGGIVVENSKATIKNNIITGNKSFKNNRASYGGGGGISIVLGYAHIYNNIIMNNSSGYACGIVFNYAGGDIKNNIIYHNWGGNQLGTGAVMIWDAAQWPAYIENNTIVANRSYLYTGAISINLQAKAYVKNNIIWGNIQNTGNEVFNEPTSVMIYNNSSQDLPGSTNLNIYPKFTDSLFIVDTASDCIDAGDQSDIYFDPALDNGIALFPSQGTNRNDIGAYGGPNRAYFPLIEYKHIYVTSPNNELIVNNTDTFDIDLNIRNLSTLGVTIDSLGFMGGFNVLEQSKLNARKLLPIESFEHVITFTTGSNSSTFDTLLIFHSEDDIENPIKIRVGEMPINIPGNEFGMNNISIYPNPVQDFAVIDYSLHNKDRIHIELFDIMGKKIENIENNIKPAGNYQINYCRNSEINNGIYLIRLSTSNGSFIKRIVFN